MIGNRWEAAVDLRQLLTDHKRMIDLLLLTAAFCGVVDAQGSAMLIPAERAIVVIDKKADDARWAKQPTFKEIADTAAAKIKNGARVALGCTVDRTGRLRECEELGSEPDQPIVLASALRLVRLYRLAPDQVEQIRGSTARPQVWLHIIMPDSRGYRPTGCNPAFGCIIEPPPPPPPPPPSDVTNHK